MKTATASKVYRQMGGITEATYGKFLHDITMQFLSVTDALCKLFTTDATGLFQAFLDTIPEEYRQHYTCHACQEFTDNYGGLVTIDGDGHPTPVMWDYKKVRPFFKEPVRAVEILVSKAKVTGIFLSSETVWGKPITGPWHHMSLALPGPLWSSATQTANQAMAEVREDHNMLCRAITEFPLAAIEQAIVLLKTDSLYRSEKCLGVAEWFRDLHIQRTVTKHKKLRDNLMWRAAASAPAGWCHVRSTMIGTLLEDIVSGYSFEVVSKRFAEKMHPLQYQRPTAPPSAGNILQAEKKVEQLGIAKSLERRLATLDDLITFWKPAAPRPAAPQEGVFGHLKPKGAVEPGASLDIPPITMTWSKFVAEVLPEAEKIEFDVPGGSSSFVALVTAVDPEAPPIIQWDHPDARNPVSWYVYNPGSYAHQWGLTARAFCPVAAICYTPAMWDEENPHPNQGKHIFFILEGARDSQFESSGLGLFPEILKSELHDIRATIEAFSQKGKLQDVETPAAGIMLQASMTWNFCFRVTSKGTHINYKLDRWD